MDKAIYMAVNSIKADKIKQINAVHEVANVSTVGFKKAFDLTVETFRVDLPGSFTSRFLLTPEELGVVDLTPGSRMATEQPLDIFIEAMVCLESLTTKEKLHLLAEATCGFRLMAC